MKKTGTVLTVVFSLLAVIVSLSLMQQLAIAQSATSPNSPSAQQQPAPPTGEQTSASESKTFTGKIVKSGDKLVLSDKESKTTYQLDDQEKAQEYLNKSVKVTGVLDSATSTIHVSAIGPA